MATGDNIQTARVVAEKCGIIRKGDDLLALDREEFSGKVTDVNGYIVQQKLDRIWPRLRVLAGCNPTDKYNLVSKLASSPCPSVDQDIRIESMSKCDDSKRNKEVIAFIGRGTNDGPAMNAADVAIAMVMSVLLNVYEATPFTHNRATAMTSFSLHFRMANSNSITCFVGLPLRFFTN